MKPLFALLLIAHSAIAGDPKPVQGVGKLTLILNGAQHSGTLYEETKDAGLGPDGKIVETKRYSIFYVSSDSRLRRYPLAESEATEFIQSVKAFADPNTRYSVLRTTDGYTAGTAQEITVYAKEGGGLSRYSDLPRKNQQRLDPKYRAANPIFTSVRYSITDAERENKPGTSTTDAHGRILMNEDGRVNYMTYSKGIDVHDVRLEDGQSTLAGVFPSVADAIARSLRGETAQLRFAADFGPQYNGVAVEGKARANQLMPLIPLGQVTNPHTKEILVVALPPDMLKDYKNGRVKLSKLLLIPPSAIRYVPSVEKWNHVIDDYLELRSTGRAAERIFVANRKTVRTGGESNTGSLTAGDIFSQVGGGGLEESLRSLRSGVPDALLDMEPQSKPNKSGSSGPCKLDGLPLH